MQAIPIKNKYLLSIQQPPDWRCFFLVFVIFFVIFFMIFFFFDIFPIDIIISVCYILYRSKEATNDKNYVYYFNHGWNAGNPDYRVGFYPTRKTMHR